MSDNMEHITQLNLTDRQVIFITNAVNFAVISLRKHPDVQTPEDFVAAVSNGFMALDTTNGRTIRDTLVMMQTAADEVVKRGGVTVKVHVPASEQDSLDDFDN